jgi:hypothetical protein
MNEILVNALLARIKAGLMSIDQVPIPYQEEVRVRLEQDGDVKGVIEAKAKVMEG